MTLRRTVLIGLAALAIGPGAAYAAAAPTPLSPEDLAKVDQATAYLQGLAQVKGRFVQTSPRGAVSRGDLYLKRPGKARFAYDPPSALLVVSDGYNVSVYDQRLRTFDQYPLGATPLALFLARQVRLDKGVKVTRVDRLSDGFTLTARDGRRLTEGQISLTFAENPMALRAWSLTDAQGQVTRVEVAELRPVDALDPGLFVLHDPRPPRMRP